jgi:hypothetical protein
MRPGHSIHISIDDDGVRALLIITVLMIYMTKRRLTRLLLEEKFHPPPAGSKERRNLNMEIVMKLNEMGRVTSLTKGQLFSNTHVDGIQNKLQESPGVYYASQPTPVFPQVRTKDPI